MASENKPTFWDTWKSNYYKWTGASGRMGQQDWAHDDISHVRETTRDTMIGKSSSSGHYVDASHARPGNNKRPAYERYGNEDIPAAKIAESTPASTEDDIPIGSGTN